VHQQQPSDFDLFLEFLTGSTCRVFDVVDDEKLAKLETATDIKEQPPYKGERIHNLTGRDLSCGTFRGADLRRIDFTNAILRGE